MTEAKKPGTLRLPPKPAKAAPAPRPAASAAAPAAAKQPAGKTAKPRKRPITALRTKPSAPPQAPKAPPLPDTGDRLAKRVAALVPCSRSEAEQYIEGGWVRVNGQVVEEPQFRVADQSVTVDANASLISLDSITLLLHKPADWVDGTEESLAKLNRQARRAGFKDARSLLTRDNHVADDPAGIRLLQRHFKHLEALVPLETAASGLVVFTQDWRVARKLNEDMDALEHELIVDVQGEVTDAHLQLLNRTLDRDRDLPHTKVSINSATPESSKLRFAIKGAHRGLIAYLCEIAKLEIIDMRRIRLGRVALRDLPAGQWRYLAAHERF